MDGEDYRMLKIIIYLNDVTDADGPFQYIPKPLTSLLYNSLKYKYGYLRDQTVNRVVPVTNWQSCLEPSGTIIFVDTASIFHRGKVPVESDRFTLFFDYTSRKPKHPFDCKSSLSQDELLMLAPRFSQRQKECIFWSAGTLREFQQI